jgi:hypothetical protein
MEVHEPPGKRDIFCGGEAQRLQDLQCLVVKVRVARGSGGQDMGYGAIGSNAYKKRSRIERFGGPALGEGYFFGSFR